MRSHFAQIAGVTLAGDVKISNGGLTPEPSTLGLDGLGLPGICPRRHNAGKSS